MRLEERLDEASGAYFEGTLIEARQTGYQLIEVFETPAFGKLMRIDGANMTSERDEFFYHENLVHPAAIAHPAPKRVLIVGGGDGGSTEEILKHPSVERVVLAELDAGVIDIARKYFHAVHHGALDDARVEIRIDDGAAAVRESKGEWDLVYLDLTDPAGAAEALYTRAFYADCRRALHGDGALVMHLGSPFAHADRVAQTITGLRAVFRQVAPYFVHIPAYGAQWGFAVASDALDMRSLDARMIDAALAGRAIGHRQYYNGAAHLAMFALPEYLRELLGSTDQVPGPRA